jgi:hypothetical protein
MERLPTLCTMGPGRKISYSEVIAFHNIIREMDTVERIITHAVRKSRDGRIDLSDFLNEAAGSMRYGVFTPMEANIIWHFASRGGMGSNQRLGLNDFQALLDAKVCGHFWRVVFVSFWGRRRTRKRERKKGRRRQKDRRGRTEGGFWEMKPPSMDRDGGVAHRVQTYTTQTNKTEQARPRDAMQLARREV